MCSNEGAAANSGRLPGMPFGLDAGVPRALLPLDQYRLQLYQYAVAERLRYPLVPAFPAPLPCYPLFPRALQPEEPKPQHSYIGLIAMAILSTPDNKLVLSDIYQYILDNYPYFRTRGPGWRNSIRHNLSLNDCFIKAGRSANGKGHFWAIHPANVDDFRKGDFRRRKAQRKVRRHMGLSVDDDADSPSPPPLPSSPLPTVVQPPATTCIAGPSVPRASQPRKRQFDVASLLAPDSTDGTGDEEDIDVVNEQRPATDNFPAVFNYYQALLQAHTQAQRAPSTSHPTDTNDPEDNNL